MSEPRPGHPAVALAGDLAQFADRVGIDGFEWIDAAAVPAPYDRLLVHGGDMTSTLERFHGSTIGLRVIRCERDGDHYFREVALIRERDGRPVEYGVIEILLDSVPPAVAERIVGGREPLGGILVESGTRFSSRPGGFFRIARGRVGGVFVESPGGEVLHGRYNQLLAADGGTIARIIEILPEEDEDIDLKPNRT